MNWEDRLKKWADSMEQSAAKVTDWGSAEVPEYLRELLLWEIVSNLLALGVWVLGTLILVGVLRLLWVKTREGWEKPEISDDHEVAGTARAIGCVALAFFCLFSIPKSYWAVESAAKAYFAPRVVIVDKLAALAGVKSPSQK